MTADLSLAGELVERLVVMVGRAQAHRAVDLALGKFSTLELAALAADWHYWARPKQLPPSTPWRSWGFLGARGLGKTRACSEYVNGEAESGRAMLIGLAAQNEDRSIAIQVNGKSGLIATAPPWFKPRWEATKKELVWPNGARASVLTPEAPGNIRAPEFHLSWCMEFQSWPVATREEAYSNFLFCTRLGYARLIWDATPKKGHPVLLKLLKRAKEEPEKHFVITGTTRENAANLGDGVIEDLEREFGGTQKGKEELGGEQLDDAENAIAKQVWIDRARRPRPEIYVRRALSIDPAVTARRGSDRTGMVEGGVGVDRQGYVLGDTSGKYTPPAWGNLALDIYVDHGCDLIIAETNKGGDLVVQNLRAAAATRNLTVIVLGKHEPCPQRADGVVFVREIYSRGEKMDRARPLSTAYEAGRISHVLDVDLSSLETTITTWEPTPGARSPDDLDALAALMTELLDLLVNAPDLSAGFEGLEVAKKELLGGGTPTDLADLFGGGHGQKI